MKALRVADGKPVLADVPVPAAGKEALVRVVCSGICNTDIEIVKGYAGFNGTIGHEFVGIVEECSDRPEFKGKRVVGEINAGCGVCRLCLAGDSRHCPERTVLGIKGRDGSHAEFLTLPSVNLYAVADSVADRAAVFVEPLAAALNITEQIDVSGEKIAVIGDGKLGLLCSFVLSLFSNEVTLIGKHASKLKLAAKRGIQTMLAEKASSFANRFDLVVEASGSETGFAAALDLVRPRGRIVLKSTFGGKPVWEAWRVVVDEITIIGSRCGRFEPALEMLENRKIWLDDLIQGEFPLGEGVRAVEKASERGVMKILLVNES